MADFTKQMSVRVDPETSQLMGDLARAFDCVYRGKPNTGKLIDQIALIAACPKAQELLKEAISVAEETARKHAMNTAVKDFQETEINEKIREEMTQLQDELGKALNDILDQVGNKLSEEEKKNIRQEVKDAQELIERLKSGYVWVALFGNTSVGKSALANSLMLSDVAEVGVEHDFTKTPTPYYKEPWAIVDVPGILGNDVQQDIAIEEAKKAHGHIFVIEQEPFGPELKLFALVHKALPDAPKIVFVNKWDVIEAGNTTSEIEVIKAKIKEKMGRFVSSPEDIVFGSAQLKVGDLKVRQELPELLDRMYENAGTLGQVMNVLDPARRSSDLNDSIRNKIFEIRVKIARRVINVCSLASAFSGAAPLGELTVTPALWVGMVLSIFTILGVKKAPYNAANVVKEISVACAQTLGAAFVAAAGAAALFDIVTTATTPIAGIGAAMGLAVDVIALGVFKFRRTATLGEATIEYIKNDFSWGADGQEAVIKRCRKRAEEQYNYLKARNKDS